jgi:hypothetical protein
MIKALRDRNELGRAYVLEAHTYLMQPKLDYAKAARLLQLGVDHDSPEAMYNLVRAFSTPPLTPFFVLFRSSFFVVHSVTWFAMTWVTRLCCTKRAAAWRRTCRRVRSY